MNYQDAIGKISWGYLFIYISLNLGSVNIFPSWAGFLLIYLALGCSGGDGPVGKAAETLCAAFAGRRSGGMGAEHIFYGAGFVLG